MQTEIKTYNDWRNYETWLVNLYIDNDRGEYDRWQEEAQSILNAATMEDSAVRELADTLKDEYEEVMPEVPGVWADLMSAALGEVDWHEIALNILESLND